MLAFVAGCATGPGAVALSTSAPLAAREPGDELYDLSPLRGRLAHLPALALRLAAPHSSRIRDPQKPVVHAALVDTFAESAVAPAVRRHLVRAAQERPDLVAPTLEWLRSPIGYEVKFAEVTAWAGERPSEDLFHEQYAEVRGDRTPRVRMQRIEAILEATGAVEATLDLTEAVGLAMARLVDRTWAGRKPLGDAALAEAIGRERRHPEVVAAYRHVVIAAVLLRCRHLTLEELDDWIAFATTEAGRWYHRTIADALLAGAREAAADVEGAFARRAAGDTALLGMDDESARDTLVVDLPSGRRVRLLGLVAAGGGGGGGGAALLLRYETALPVRDGAELTGEATDVWDYLRRSGTTGPARTVVVQATGSLEGWAFPFARSRRFAWQRGPDGDWHGVPPPDGGAVEREVLWSVPP